MASDVWHAFCSLQVPFDERAEMRPFASLALVCILMPVGKISEHETSVWKLTENVPLLLLVWVNILHSLLAAVCGLKCFTCWGANPGTCTEIWNCPHHFDRCSTSIGESTFLPHGVSLMLRYCVKHGHKTKSLINYLCHILKTANVC